MENFLHFIIKKNKNSKKVKFHFVKRANTKDSKENTERE